jgi:hypothetical protein
MIPLAHAFKRTLIILLCVIMCPYSEKRKRKYYVLLGVVPVLFFLLYPRFRFSLRSKSAGV